MANEPDAFVLFGVSPDPVTAKWFQEVLGYWIDGETSLQAVSMLVKLLGYGNAFAWPLCIIIIAYAMYAGTINTAAEGKILGRRFSSIWVPIRIVVGAALLMPTSITDNNLSGIQVGVGLIAAAGLGAGDKIWQEAYKESFTTPINLAPRIDGKNAASQTLRALTCAKFDKSWRETKMFELTDNGVNFSGGDCGSIIIPKDIEPALSKDVAKAIGTLVKDIYYVLWDDKGVPVAYNSDEAKKAFARSKFIEAANKYSVTLESAISSNLNIKPSKDIDKKSAIFAANQYLAHTKTQGIIFANAQVISQSIRYDTPLDTSSYKIFGEGYKESLLEFVGLGDEFLRSIDLEEFKRPNIKEVDLDLMHYIDFSLTEFVKLDEEGLIKHLGDWIKGITLGAISNSEKINDPLSVATALGHGLITGGQAMLVTGMGASVLVTGVGLMLIGFAFTLIINGVLLAYVLPAIPAIIWVLVFLGYLFTTIELMISGLFASALMPEPTGDGMGKYTTKFLLMLFDLFMKIPLSVIGLMLSTIVASAGFVIMKFVLFDLNSVQSSGVWGALALIAIFTWTLFVIITKSYEMVTKLPQAALGWIPEYNNSSAGHVSTEDTGKTGAGADKGLKGSATNAARGARMPGNVSLKSKGAATNAIKGGK